MLRDAAGEHHLRGGLGSRIGGSGLAAAGRWGGFGWVGVLFVKISNWKKKLGWLGWLGWLGELS